MATKLTRKEDADARRRGVLDYRLGLTRRSFQTVKEMQVYCAGWLSEERKRERFAKAANNFVTKRTINNVKGER